MMRERRACVLMKRLSVLFPVDLIAIIRSTRWLYPPLSDDGGSGIDPRL